jgi:hypothetical protein
MSMMPGQCAREKEFMALLRSGQWPAACEPELREHVEGCSLCAQTVLLKSAFASALVQAKDEARLQAPGVLWWRAQLCRRNEAVQRVNRPIAGAQWFALLINVLAAFALLASQWRHLDRIAAWFSGIANAPVFHPATLWAMAAQQPGWNLLLLIPFVIAFVVLGGITVYLATEH